MSGWVARWVVGWVSGHMSTLLDSQQGTWASVVTVERGIRFLFHAGSDGGRGGSVRRPPVAHDGGEGGGEKHVKAPRCVWVGMGGGGIVSNTFCGPRYCVLIFVVDGLVASVVVVVVDVVDVLFVA